MLGGCGLNLFLEKDKSNLSLEEFQNRFYRQLNLNNRMFESKQFDDMLVALYQKDDENYKKWYLLLRKIEYPFVRKNTRLYTDLIVDNQLEYGKLAYDMKKIHDSIISRITPKKATLTSVYEEKVELIKSLNLLLDLLECNTEDNIVNSAKNQFSHIYGNYENDKYLGSLYKSIMGNFEYDIKKAILDQINKASKIQESIIDQQNASIILDAQKQSEKRKLLSKRKTKYYD